MPSTSKKQHNFMEAVAHNPAFAKKVGVPRSVGQEFSNADKSRTFNKGGDMKDHEAHGHHMKMAHHHLKMAMKHGGHAKKMASGGSTTGMHGIEEKKGMTTAKMGKVTSGGMKAHGEHSVEKKGATKAMMPKMKGNSVGDGPLYNVKGPAMRHGGKTHHKK
jgi:hypothetical protein